MSVVLINPFHIEPAQESAFLRSWKETAMVYSAKAGYLDTRLHRSLDPDARFRYVNVAHWETAEAWSEVVSKFPPREIHLPGVEANPALYTAVEGSSRELIDVSLEDDLRKLEQDLAHAYQVHDIEFLERILDDSYVVTDGPGTVSHKAKVLSDHKDGRLQVTAFHFDEMEIRRVAADAALAMGQYTWTATYEGQPISGSFRYLRVYVRADHHWQIVAAQVTPLRRR